jgi:hypothetical protein
MVELHVGCIDEDVLLGEKMQNEAWEDVHGKHVPRQGGHGYTLAYSERHCWVSNAVPGVTDKLPGKKWLAEPGDDKNAILGDISACENKLKNA